jgi:hypothetical protein
MSGRGAGEQRNDHWRSHEAAGRNFLITAVSLGNPQSGAELPLLDVPQGFQKPDGG